MFLPLVRLNLEKFLLCFLTRKEQGGALTREGSGGLTREVFGWGANKRREWGAYNRSVRVALKGKGVGAKERRSKRLKGTGVEGLEEKDGGLREGGWGRKGGGVGALKERRNKGAYKRKGCGLKGEGVETGRGGRIKNTVVV